MRGRTGKGSAGRRVPPWRLCFPGLGGNVATSDPVRGSRRRLRGNRKHRMKFLSAVEDAPGCCRVSPLVLIHDNEKSVGALFVAAANPK